MNRGLCIALVVLVAVLGLAAVPQAEAVDLATVDSDTLTAREFLYVLSRRTEGQGVISGVVLAGMPRAERAAFLEKVVDAMVLARAAEMEGVAFREDVQRRLKWDRIDTLARAYIERRTEMMDLSIPRLERYYREHEGRYRREAAVHMLHILFFDRNKAAEVKTEIKEGVSFPRAAERYSRDQAIGQRGGDLGWIPMAQLPAPIADLVERTGPGEIGGPVETLEGYNLIKVLEKREGGLPPFEQIMDQVREDLAVELLEQEIGTLRKRYNVEIHRDRVGRLGGIPVN
ncbi:MAG: peptidylprolyl isomerase [Synergistales bacterium]|nr:peptidylprolyl isomerase [Synergistales bacterium]